MAKMRDPRAIANKQVERLAGSTSEIEAGISGVTEAPTAKAAKSLDKARDRYVEAINSGRMAKNLNAVSLEEWQSKTLSKVGRIPEGARAAMDTIVAFHTQRNAHQETINRKLNEIPKRTLDDSIRRMTEQVKGMANFHFDKSQR